MSLTMEEKIQLAEKIGEFVVSAVEEILAKRGKSEAVNPAEPTAKIGEMETSLASNDSKADDALAAKFPEAQPMPANKEPGK